MLLLVHLKKKVCFQCTLSLYIAAGYEKLNEHQALLVYGWQCYNPLLHRSFLEYELVTELLRCFKKPKNNPTPKTSVKQHVNFVK